MRTGWLAAIGVAAVLPGFAAVAGADSFTPVRLTITIASTAHRGTALPVTVAVSADPGVLDGSEGPMRIGVKLAGECGGSFETTGGAMLLDQQLSPQPSTGRAYSATAKGSGTPAGSGAQTVCVYLEDSDIGRVYASDESHTVDVLGPLPAGSGSGGSGGGAGKGPGGSGGGSVAGGSGAGGSRPGTGAGHATRACTRADRRYRAARRTLTSAQRRLRHTHGAAARRRLRRAIARDQRTVNADRRRARAACGRRARL